MAATVASCARFCDHVIAVDGAYFLYPDRRASSGGDQAETIHAVATANGMGCTIHVPADPWLENEIGKRNAYCRLALAIGTPHEDWLFALDSDEVISEVSPLARADLAETELNAANVGFWTTDELRSWFGPTRRLYRMLEDIRYGPSHYTIRGTDRSGDEVFVNGRGVTHGARYGEIPGAALDLTTQVRVEHKHHLRPEPRGRKATEYNEMALRMGIEPWVEVES